jgi:hypothetical protein
VFLKNKTNLGADSPKLARAQTLKTDSTQINLARVWAYEVRAATQQCGLACTVGTDEGYTLARRYCEVDPAQHRGMSVIAFGQPTHYEICRAELT